MITLTTPKLESRVAYRDADGYLRHGVLKTIAYGWARIDGDDGVPYLVRAEHLIGPDNRTDEQREADELQDWINPQMSDEAQAQDRIIVNRSAMSGGGNEPLGKM